MYKYLACTYACMYTLCTPGALGGQTRALAFPKQGLDVVVGHHMGAVNGIWVGCKSSQFSKWPSHLSSPYL